MINKVIKLWIVVTLISATSCKKKDDFQTVRTDANNLVVPQNFSSNASEVEKTVEKQNKKKITDYPKIEIVGEEIFDFGTITEGDIVKHTFKVKNVGKSDLTILHAQASCGCTIPDWTKRPILPGEVGEINISFNSTGKIGDQKKSVTLTTNTENGHEVLRFRTLVEPKNKK